MNYAFVPARRRGGLTDLEVKHIHQERTKPRPTPWQHLAQQMGRPVEMIREAVQ